MKLKYLVLLFLSLNIFLTAASQKNKTDSLQVAKTLNEILTICRSIDFADPKVLQPGAFYEAAPYVIYRGDDKKRKWKDFADYNKADEKLRVDEVCERINRTANQYSTYTIIKYFTETESEGTWHVLMVTYKNKDVKKTSAYAFLKINGRFGLGDID